MLTLKVSKFVSIKIFIKKICSHTFYIFIGFLPLCSQPTFSNFCIFKTSPYFLFWTFLKCPFSKIDPTLFSIKREPSIFFIKIPPFFLSFLSFFIPGSLTIKLITPLINNIMQPEYYFYSILSARDSINYILENLSQIFYKNPLKIPSFLYVFIG
jgi:hypothetical protein